MRARDEIDDQGDVEGDFVRRTKFLAFSRWTTETARMVKNPAFIRDTIFKAEARLEEEETEILSVNTQQVGKKEREKTLRAI